MMEAISTSETSATFYETTRRNISEESHLYTRRFEISLNRNPSKKSRASANTETGKLTARL
jgi:hypothetical protein